MIHDFIYKPFKLILIHTGATIRFLYHRMVLKEKYSYHAFIINPPHFDYEYTSYKEEFEKWKHKQNKSRNMLTSEQELELEELLKQGMTREEALTLMYYSGDIEPIDTNIYPRDPEYFTNRTFDGILGFIAILAIIIIVSFCH